MWIMPQWAKAGMRKVNRMEAWKNRNEQGALLLQQNGFTELGKQTLVSYMILRAYGRCTIDQARRNIAKMNNLVLAYVPRKGGRQSFLRFFTWQES